LKGTAFSIFVEQFADPFRRFSSKINPNCRKQYARLCYLYLSQKQWGQQFETKIRRCLGSIDEQEIAARDFGLLNHVFQLYRRSRRYQAAYEIALDIGLLEEALSLARTDAISLRSSDIATIVNYIQAPRLIFANKGSERNKRIQKSDPGPNNRSILLLEEQWKQLARFLNGFTEKAEIPSTSNIQSDILREFLILLV
jgi:hypothetical protein